MPAGQSQDSVCEAMACMDNDNAMWVVSPVSNLTQRMSGASFHSSGNTPVHGAVGASATAAAGKTTPLLSDTIRFGIDDSNDSLMLFSAASVAAAAAATAASTASFQSLTRRRFTDGDAAEGADAAAEEEDEVEWVLGAPARLLADERETRESGGTPCRPRALTFCSSPSEPTVRRLWSPEGASPRLPPHRLASAPFGIASSPTSETARRATGRAHVLPPPSLPPPQPRRRSFKRPSPSSSAAAVEREVGEAIATPSGRQAATPKRRRLAKTPLGDATNSTPQRLSATQQPAKKPLLQRCTSELSALTSKFSATLDSVKVDKAITSIDSMNLIGNSEQQHSLPTVKELSYGIRYVTGATVSRLVRGDFSDRVPNFSIIDCRYPYEFDGGHIQGAINIYKQEDLLTKVMDPVVAASVTESGSQQQRRAPVLIFHCEFSSERAPKLAHYLRDHDRMRNAENYPNLYFPEVYVLQGGYKSFFESHMDDCQPPNYTRMADPSFKAELAAFQRDRKTWERQNSRTKHSQLQRLASCQQLH